MTTTFRSCPLCHLLYCNENLDWMNLAKREKEKIMVDSLRNVLERIVAIASCPQCLFADDDDATPVTLLAISW